MKKIIFSLLFLCTLIPATVSAQEDDAVPQDPKVVEKLQNLRIAYISEKLGLTPGQAEKFWPVYREFVQERAAIRKEVKDFSRTVSKTDPDPKTQQQLVDLGLKARQREVDLEKDYSGRLLKIINAQQVLNLRKAEQDFRTMVRNQMPQRKLQQERKENLRDRNQRLREKKRDR